MNLTKNLPPPQNECVTATTEDEKAKGKKTQMCRSTWELLNATVTSGLILWDQGETTLYLWLAKNIQGKQGVILHSYQNIQSFVFLWHPGSMRSQSYKLLAWNPWKSTLFYHFNCLTRDWSTCWRQHSTISCSGTLDLFVHVTDEQLDPSNHLE